MSKPKPTRKNCRCSGGMREEMRAGRGTSGANRSRKRRKSGLFYKLPILGRRDVGSWHLRHEVPGIRSSAEVRACDRLWMDITCGRFFSR